MKNIVCFSGGKDSTALVLWAKENLPEFTAVFCDTRWEHPITYAYIEEINRTLLSGKLVTVKSETYPGGFVQLAIDRKGFPSTKRRFCTQELKVYPLHKYYESLDDGEIVSYQGVRADESASRAAMCEVEWVNDAGGYEIRRPLLRWSAEDCFSLMKRHGVRPNPLYLLGSSRVGCWPCINTGLGELKRAMMAEPELRERIVELERTVNENVANRETRKWPATFWSAGTIPARFCSLSGEVECRQCKKTEDGLVCKRCGGSGKYIAYVPTANDVFSYIESVDIDQLPLIAGPACMSVYNLCE